MKYILMLGVVTLGTFVSGRAPCVGCSREVKGSFLEPLEEALKKALSKLATDDGPSYEFVKINYAKKKKVGGLLYKINAVIRDKNGNSKTCDFHILKQPWVANQYTLTLICRGEETVIKHYSL